jgi:hypothetical protein
MRKDSDFLPCAVAGQVINDVYRLRPAANEDDAPDGLTFPILQVGLSLSAGSGWLGGRVGARGAG